MTESKMSRRSRRKLRRARERRRDKPAEPTGDRMIERGWKSYARLIPDGADDVQIAETRQAFYAGAAIIFEALAHASETESEDVAVRRLADLQKEIDAFGQELDARYIDTLRTAH